MRSAVSWKEREWGRNHLNTKRLKSRSGSAGDSGTGMCCDRMSVPPAPNQKQ